MAKRENGHEANTFDNQRRRINVIRHGAEAGAAYEYQSSVSCDPCGPGENERNCVARPVDSGPVVPSDLLGDLCDADRSRRK
jgi:hypothetical protein